MNGFGSRTAALAGSGVSWGFEGYAAYSNPAGLGVMGSRRLVLSYGILDQTPNFTRIRGVVTENSYVSDKPTPTTGDVDTGYRATFGQAIGLAYKLAPEFHDVTVGAAIYVPLAQTAYIDTGEIFEPEYFLYRARTQRPQFELGAGGEIGKGVRVGLGLHLSLAMTTNATAMLAINAGQSSSMRQASSVKPRIAPYLGVLLVSEPGREEQADVTDFGPKGSHSFGAVLRFPLASESLTFLSSAATLAGGGTPAPDLNFTTRSTLYYDPLSLEMGGSYQYRENARAYLQLDYEAWSHYKIPAMSTVDASCTTSGCGITLQPIDTPSYRFHDIVVPRIAHEIQLGRVIWRAGYSYHASILKDLSTGAGNYVDPPKHSLNLGAGLRFKHFLSFDEPFNLDINASYAILVHQHITKAPGDEVGNLSSEKVGSPGYDVGGKIFGLGVSLTLAF
jgi:hypothetical protein